MWLGIVIGTLCNAAAAFVLPSTSRRLVRSDSGRGRNGRRFRSRAGSSGGWTGESSNFLAAIWSQVALARRRRRYRCGGLWLVFTGRPPAR